MITYTSSNSFSDFHKALYRFVEDNLLTVVNNSPALGVMCEESCDITVPRHCIVYCKAIDKDCGQVREIFLGNAEVKGAANGEHNLNCHQSAAQQER